MCAEEILAVIGKPVVGVVLAAHLVHSALDKLGDGDSLGTDFRANGDDERFGFRVSNGLTEFEIGDSGLLKGIFLINDESRMEEFINFCFLLDVIPIAECEYLHETGCDAINRSTGNLKVSNLFVSVFFKELAEGFRELVDAE